MCPLHYDKQYICPICGNSQLPLLPVGSSFPILKELQVVGSGNRLQKCNGCNGSDRDRLAFLYLRDYENLFDGGPHKIRIVHVAPEDCIAKHIMAIPKVDYHPIDSFEHGYEYPNYIKKMNLLNLSFADQSVDLLICNHVLQDISDDRAAMREIWRVLKHGGKAMLQVPLSPIIDSIKEHQGEKSQEECKKAYGQRFHKRVYNEDGFLNRLISCGFETYVYDISNNYPLHSLNPKEKIHIAFKK